MAWFLVLLIPAGTIGAFVLAGYGFGTLGRIGLRAAGRELRLRCFAAVLGAAAAVLYTWGLLHVAGAMVDAEDGGTNSSPPLPCLASDRTGDAASVVDYSVSYVPLRFVCETADGESYAAGSVPGYVNPTVPVFGLAGLACAGTAAVKNARVGPKL